jgi:hypothetical protein
MARYFVVHNSVTYNCGIVTVVMTTKTFQHLWLLVSFNNPLIDPQPDRRQRSNIAHQNNYRLAIEADYEQEEAGNTQTHTFTFRWPFPKEVLFMYAINMGTARLKATRTPIFAYRLKQTPLLQETWPSTGVPDLPWQFSGFSGGFPPRIGGNQLSVQLGSQQGVQAILDVTALPLPSNLDLCNLVVTTSLPFFSRPGNRIRYARLAARFRTHSSFEFRDVYIDGWRDFPSCPNALAGLIGTEVQSGSPIGMHMAAAANLPSDLCGLPLNLIPSPYLDHIELDFELSGPALPAGSATAVAGMVTFSSLAGELEDISGLWRSLRLSPYIP